MRESATAQGQLLARRFCAASVAGFLLLLLLAAGGCSRSSSSKGTVHLTLACWEGPEGLASLTRLLDRYKEQHPNVSIEIQQVPGAQYYQRLKIQFAAGVAPDIMQLAYNQLPTFAYRNALEPLDHLIRRDKFPVDKMFPELLPALKYRQKFYGLPRGWTTFVLYYNQDMFDAAHLPYPHEGWTWEDFLAAGRKLTKDLDGDGRPDQFACDAPTQTDGLAFWIWQNGGRLFTPDMSRCLLDQPPALEALRFLRDCQYKYGIFPSPEQAQDLGGGGEMFRNGRQAMFIQGRWGCLSFRDAKYPDGRPVRWDVGPPPMKKEKATVLFANCYVLRKNGPNLEEAWKLMQWLTGVQGQIHQARTGRDMPSFISVAESPVFLDPRNPPEHDRVFLDVAAYARPLEVDPNTGAVDELVLSTLTQIFTARKDPDKAARQLTSAINAIIRDAKRQGDRREGAVAQ